MSAPARKKSHQRGTHKTAPPPSTAGVRTRVQIQRSTANLADAADTKLARGLGWFSIALGAAEVISPDRISKLIGLKEDHRTLIRLFGLREITSGVGLLLQDDRAAWRWSRVVGDALDL